MRHRLAWRTARSASRFLLFLIASTNVSATNPGTDTNRYTFDTLWSLLQQSNPTLTAARARRDMAEGERLQAAVRPNPTLDISSENIGTEQREDAISVSQAFELGGKRAARMQLAEQGRTLADAAVDAAQATLYADLRTAFIASLAADAKWSLARTTLKLAERSARAVDKQIAAGELARVAATRASVDVANARLALNRAHAERLLAGKQLANLVNQTAPISVDGSLEVLPEVPPLEALDAQLSNAPALRAAREETARRQAEVAVQASRKFGDVTFSAGVKHLAETNEPAGVLGMSLPLPLSDRNQGNIVRAQGAVAQAAAEEHATELSLRGELRRFYQNYTTALATAAEIRTAILPAAESALVSMERGFRLGKFGLAEVLDTRRTLLQARHQLVDALTEAQLAHAGIIRIVGTRAASSSH